MSGVFQGLLNEDGRLRTGGGPTVSYFRGLPLNAASEIVVDAAGAIYFNQGTPMNAVGVAMGDDDVDAWGPGGLPLNAVSAGVYRVAASSTSPIDHYQQGLPYDADGRLCVGGGTPPPPPKQFYTDFENYADTAALLAEWTPRLNLTSVTYSLLTESGKKYARLSRGSNAFSALTWDILDSVDGRENFEILARLRTSSTGSIDCAGLCGRESGVTGVSENRAAIVLNASANVIRRNFVINQVGGGINTSVPTTTSTVWQWFRFRVNGTDVFIKAWPGDVTDEPVGWGGTFTVTGPTAAGRIGFLARNAGNHDFDVFSVGVDGEPAPTGPV
jgi:hypothetical protein